MAERRLSPEERALWRQLARSVRPLGGTPLNDRAETVPEGAVVAAPATPPKRAAKSKISLTRPADPRPSPVPARRPVPVLDGSWERQIGQGRLTPDMAIDLHGHTLAAAHARLDLALTQARAQGVRVLLVVTGKARDRVANGGERGRGAIRAEIGHWLDHSRHADMIASVRNAHPRHGGDGALYVILRRKKS